VPEGDGTVTSACQVNKKNKFGDSPEMFTIDIQIPSFTPQVKVTRTNINLEKWAWHAVWYVTVLLG
jgi:hypothetical protein